MFSSVTRGSTIWLLLQIQECMAAGHQLLGIRTSNALLLQLLSDSILPYDIQILLSCYKHGPDWLRRGESLLANHSFTPLVRLAAVAFGAFAVILPPCSCFCWRKALGFFSAETAHKDLSPVVLHLVLCLGEKNQSGMEAVEPQQEACSLLPVSCCDWKLSCRCHWPVGWDGRKLTGPISAGGKSSVIRIKPYSCQSCYFFSTFLLLGVSYITHSSAFWCLRVAHTQECGPAIRWRRAEHNGSWTGLSAANRRQCQLLWRGDRVCVL